MTESERTHQSLIAHYKDYPKLQIADLFKYLFQSAFGCEHLVSSQKDAVEYIKSEHAQMKKGDRALTERLDGDYSRVDLAFLDGGLSAETLGRLFFLSAKKEVSGREELKEKLSVALTLAESGELPFPVTELRGAIDEWQKNDYCAVRHSETFRQAYAPAYRVVANKYARFLPVFSKIDAAMKKGSAIIAIEGGSASGKTTLAGILSEVYDCNVFHMDDFFLRPEQRTPQRFAEVGGNVDRERFLEEVLTPLSQNKTVQYRRFDCSTQVIEPPVAVEPKALTIIEGAYSIHPELSPYYDLSVFLDISPEYQRGRILKRNSPQFAERFFGEWIPLELKYFSETKARDRCDIVLDIDEIML